MTAPATFDLAAFLAKVPAEYSIIGNLIAAAATGNIFGLAIDLVELEPDVQAQIQQILNSKVPAIQEVIAGFEAIGKLLHASGVQPVADPVTRALAQEAADANTNG